MLATAPRSRLTKALLGALTCIGLWACPVARADVSSLPSEPISVGQDVALSALALIGVPYRMGGETVAEGMDCSGLVRWVYSQTAGIALPRRSEEISRTGESIQLPDARPGDLLFFNTQRRAFSHVGIYLGNNQFVHAPSRGGVVRVETVTADYWSTRFNGARRVLPEREARGGLLAQNPASLIRPEPLPAEADRAAQAPQIASRPWRAQNNPAESLALGQDDPIEILIEMANGPDLRAPGRIG